MRRKRIWAQERRPTAGRYGVAMTAAAILLGIPAFLVWTAETGVPSCGSHVVETQLLNRLGAGVASAVDRVSLRALPAGAGTGQRCLGTLVADGRERVVDFTILPADGPDGFRLVLRPEQRS